MKNLTIICLLFLANNLTAQIHIPGPMDKPSQSEITFEKDEHDYGTIKEGSNGIYKFKFTNTGAGPLIIIDAKGSCVCTVPEWPKEPIKPGETAYITVTYDTKKLGPIDKSVRVISNAKSDSEIILRIKGTVKESVKKI